MRRWRTTAMSLLAAGALAACTSASDVLQPTATAPQSTQSVPATADLAVQTAADTTTKTTPTQTAPPAPPAQNAAALSKTRLQIAPLVGASVEAATPLTERLSMRARERGMTLVGSTDTTATNVLKGYFSVVTEGKDTTVIYVWDLYDPSGNRLHRINGQQKAPSADGAEGWPAVSAATMQAVADQTVDQLAAWLSGKTG